MYSVKMESARLKLEELEALENAGVQAFWMKKRGRSGHRLLHLNLDFKLASIVSDSSKAMEKLMLSIDTAAAAIESDAEAIRLGGADAFYKEKRLADEYNKKHHTDTVGNEEYSDRVNSFEQDTLNEHQTLQWSGEERLGRYLDLHSQYLIYLNLGDFNKVTSYIGYLDSLKNDHLSGSIPLKLRSMKPYGDYLENLLAYLKTFHERAQALKFLDFDTVEKRFEILWTSGKLRGWERRSSVAPRTLSSTELSHELLVRGMKAGGREEDKVRRFEQVLEFERSEGGLNCKIPVQRKLKLFDARRIALLEYNIAHVVLGLRSFFDDTKVFVARKQTLMPEEVAREEEEERLREMSLLAAGENHDGLNSSEDEDERNTTKNKLNMPLDVDGQPMQLWMYKLYGLRQEFRCEICGNYTYRGRRNFDKHFQEARHAQAMYVLGIPNTAHFHDITSISEARILYDKLKKVLKESAFDRSEHEQVEDSQGNVYSRKTYEDLRRQGLL